MRYVADLHLHSKYSRAVSERMILPEIARWADLKGIDLIATADYTHPLWHRELLSQLEEAGNGLYQLKNNPKAKAKFILSTELSCIYSQGGRGRRIHLLVLAPSFEVVARLNERLSRRGVKLMADGRPILGMSARDLASLIWEIDEKCVVSPCHVWTPWYSLYGSRSGFDSIEECFGDLAEKITAVETGLSSDPAMNWRIAELENRVIVSFSDAHSPEKLGREATILEGEFSYQGIRQALAGWSDAQKSATKVVGTIEFYPEEGKYHYTGHRECQVRHCPEDSARLGTTCPVCGKPLTVGVMHRVEDLASLKPLVVDDQLSAEGVRWLKHPANHQPPYVRLVPLLEIIAEARGQGVGGQSVLNNYLALVNQVGSEFEILLKTSLADLRRIADERVVEGIRRVRRGELLIEPGFDGVFGKVSIFDHQVQTKATASGDQLELF